jgi:probable HAF family extracellular repeat protein
LNGETHAFIIPLNRTLEPVWDLGHLGAGYSIAYSVNSSGQVVGLSYKPVGQYYETRAFLHVHGRGQMVDLNSRVLNLSDWKLVNAEGINDAGYICGWGYKGASTTSRAFLLVPTVYP